MVTGAALIRESYLANLVLQDTIERIFVKGVYADISRGIFLVRGENVLLLGEIVCLQIMQARRNADDQLARTLTKTIIYPNHSKRCLRKKFMR